MIATPLPQPHTFLEGFKKVVATLHLPVTALDFFRRVKRWWPPPLPQPRTFLEGQKMVTNPLPQPRPFLEGQKVVATPLPQPCTFLEWLRKGLPLA